MEIVAAIVGILGIAFGAFVVRVIVRAVNLGKLPARRMWLGVALLPVLYVLSVGPAIMVVHKVPALVPVAQVIYYPLESLAMRGPEPFKAPLNWYANLWR